MHLVLIVIYLMTFPDYSGARLSSSSLDNSGMVLNSGDIRGVMYYKLDTRVYDIGVSVAMLANARPYLLFVVVREAWLSPNQISVTSDLVVGTSH